MAREYDREYTKNRSQRARVRLGFDTAKGVVKRFVLQLEYRLGEEWVEVVRFDHDSAGEFAHNVSRDGVHMDVFRAGEKHREEIFPPMEPAKALNFAEAHLAEHAKQYIKRFERWHGIRSR